MTKFNIRFKIKKIYTLFIIKLLPKQFKTLLKLIVLTTLQDEKDKQYMKKKQPKIIKKYNYEKIFLGEL